MGAFFIKFDVLEAGDEEFWDAFYNKVVMYLYEDAAKHKNLFKGRLRYSEIVEKLKKDLSVFDIDNIHELVMPDIKAVTTASDIKEQGTSSKETTEEATSAKEPVEVTEPKENV